VLLGRQVLWGLACDDEDGVGRVLSILEDEIVGAMALAGCPDLSAVRHLTVSAWRAAS
jgi:isopentenyl diphosphate isomerase/L-lactate dehydrogenase-like FMN-dependent dehydrogenase